MMGLVMIVVSLMIGVLLIVVSIEGMLLTAITMTMITIPSPPPPHQFVSVNDVKYKLH